MVYFRPALDGRMDGDGNSKLMIYNLERAIRLMPRNSWQYTIVIDCEGVSRQKRPAGVLGYFSCFFGGGRGAASRVSSCVVRHAPGQWRFQGYARLGPLPPAVRRKDSIHEAAMARGPPSPMQHVVDFLSCVLLYHTEYIRSCSRSQAKNRASPDWLPVAAIAFRGASDHPKPKPEFPCRLARDMRPEQKSKLSPYEIAGKPTPLLLSMLSLCGKNRHGSEAAASGSVHEEDVQAAEPPLPDAARPRALHERGAQRDALLEGCVAPAASQNKGQDAPHPFNVGKKSKVKG